MKHIILSISISLISLLSYGQVFQLDSLYWSDDFSNAANWVIGNEPGTTGDWVIGTGVPSGDFPIDGIESTTAANGFALFDSDLFCSSFLTQGDAHVQLANSVDLTGFGTGFILQFEQHYRQYQGASYVEVSTDGTNWTSYQVNAGLGVNDATDNPDFAQVDISGAVAANPSTVWIRFRYIGVCDYSWMVDDVSIYSGVIFYPPCVAGVLSTTGFPIDVCPGDVFSLISDGSEAGDGGFGFAMNPGANAGGGTGASITVGPYTAFGFALDDDLGGLLSASNLPVLTGSWVFYGLSYDASGEICAQSADSVTVTFLPASDCGVTPPTFFISPDTLGNCGTTTTTSVFYGTTDSTVFNLPFIGDVAVYFDAFRVNSVDGLPAGLTLTTDVMNTADVNAPFGYWYNQGTIPNQMAAQGTVEIQGDISGLIGGGPNNDGIYPFTLELEARVGSTVPDASIIIPNEAWTSDLPILEVDTIFIDLYLSVNGSGAVTVNLAYINQDCFGTDASITFTSSVTPLSYYIDSAGPLTNLSNTIDFTGLLAGQTYDISITDVNGCSYNEQLFYPNTQPYELEELCLVSVDTLTGKNQLSWEKTLGVETDYFKIYKQNNATSNYDSVGMVSIDSLSTFIDLTSAPNQSSDRYKISVVDVCGNESIQSYIHRTIHLSANQGLSGEVNLSWNAYEGFFYSNFEIWRSNNSSPYSLISTIANNNFSYTDVAPPSGTNTYRVAVVNPNGCSPTRAIERAISNIVDEEGNIVTDIYQFDNNSLTVYPNPSSGIFTVNVLYQSNIQASVFDALGKLVSSSSETGTFNLDLSEVPVGVYTLRLDTESGTVTRKILRE